MPLAVVERKSPRRERLKPSAEVRPYDPREHKPYLQIPESICELMYDHLKTQYEMCLVQEIARQLWRHTTDAKREIPAWTQMNTNADLARKFHCSVKTIITTVNALAEIGIIAATADPKQHGYRYALLPENWKNPKPRPKPALVISRANTAGNDGEEQTSTSEEQTQDLPTGKSTPADRLVILPGRTQTITLSKAVRRAGKAEVRNEVAAAQVETWEEAGVFRIRISPNGEWKATPDLPAGKSTPPGERVAELRELIGKDWLKWFRKPLDSRLAAKIVQTLAGAPVGQFVIQMQRRVKQGGEVRSGLAINIAEEVAADYCAWLEAKAAQDARDAESMSPPVNGHGLFDRLRKGESA